MKPIRFISLALVLLLLSSCTAGGAVSQDTISYDTVSTVSEESITMDYTVKNLVAGLKYKVQSGVDINCNYARLNAGTSASKGLLTDGVYSKKADYSSSAYHIFYRGLSRDVIFDLGETKSVCGFKINFLQNSPAGIEISDYVECYISEDGTNYMLAHRDDLSARLSETQVSNVTSECSFDACKGRYVKIKFRVAINCYVDEIEVLGCDVKGDERDFEPYDDGLINAYEAPTDGARDMVLLYCGYKDKYDDSFVQNTEDEMIYYFGYCDKDGNVKDTMFDSFMFSALGNTLPSGRSTTIGGDAPLKSDYEYYIDSIFDTEYNCGAIERAVERVKTATGKQDYTVSLVITMPYPNLSDTQTIGDFDGDGKSEKCRTEADQLKVFAWFMDACIAKFNERGYQNIVLKGFYWENENIKVSQSVAQKSLISATSALCHERGKMLFWIPLLYGNGFDYAKEIGFDSVMMQPNLSFYDFTSGMMQSFAETVKKYNLGVEMEIHWNALTDASLRSKFYAYLNAGVKYGYMENASHSYYQNSNPGTFYTAAVSSDPAARKIYDDVYKFIKHTYTVQ